MQKLLRTLTLMALLLVPWVTQAQQTLTVYETATGTNEYVPFYGYYADEPQQNQMIYPASELSDMVGQTITQMVFYIDHVSGSNNIGNWIVSLGETSSTTLSGVDNTTALTQVYSGAMTFNSGETMMTVVFENDYVYNGGNLLIEFNHPVAASYKHYYFIGETVDGASYCYNGQRNFLPKVTFSYETPASCNKPTNVNVTLGSGDNATISWTSDASAWNISVNGTVTPITTNPYTLTGLTLSTTYEVMVQADCGANGTSNWSNAVSFTTPSCWGGHFISYTMSDSYGDGWNGAAILVKDACGNVIQTLTVDASSTSGVLDLCGEYYEFVWQSGSYDSECSFTFIEAGSTLFVKPSSVSNGLVLQTLGTIACPAPTALAANNLTVNSAELSWTENGTATAWQLCVNGDETNLINVATNPYTLSGLAENTDYTIKLRANCGESQSCWTEVVDFTTLANCPAPVLADNYAGGSEALLSWTSDATAWNISVNGTVTSITTNPYTLPLALSTTYEVMVQADCGSIGTSDWSNVVTFTTPDCWGGHLVSYTMADSYGDGWNGAAILVKDACGNVVETLTMSDGASNSGSLSLCGEYYEFVWQTGSYDNECSFTFSEGGTTLFTTPDALSSGLVLHTLGTISCPAPTGFAASNLTVNSAELSWTENGTATAWQLCVNGDETNLVNVTTNPYPMTGLAEHTDYTVKLRANCGENQSCWTDEIDFTTLANCQAVEGLAYSNLTATGATLTWTDLNSGTNTYTVTNVTTSEVLTSTLTATTYDVTGLTPNTNYTFSVAVNCGSATSGEETVSLKTLCSSIDVSTVAYTEDFESYTAVAYNAAGGVVPDCWDVIASGTNANYSPHVSTSYAANGKGMVMTSGSANYGANNYVILPVFVQNVSDLQIDFSKKFESASSGTLTLGYITDVTDESTYVPLYTVTRTSTAAATDYYSFIDDVVPAGARIAFRFAYSSSYWSASIDDVVVSMHPTCFDPTSVVVDDASISTNGATLNWIRDDHNATGETYTIYNVTTSQIVATGVSALTYPLTGLEEFTEYTFRVNTECAEPTTGVTVTFTTLAGCQAVQNLAVSSMTANEVAITWTDPNAGTNTYTITKNGEVVSSTWNTTTYTFTGLTEQTDYTFSVTVNCPTATSVAENLDMTTPCAAISTFPITYGFESEEGFTGSTAAQTTNTIGQCWRNIATVGTGSNLSRVWCIYTSSSVSYVHNGTQSLKLQDKGSSSAGVSKTLLVFPPMNFTAPTGYTVSFWIRRDATTSNPEGFMVYASNTDTIDANAVYLGHYSRNYGMALPQVESAAGWYQYETEPITLTGNVYLIFEGQSYYGNATYVDDIEIKVAPSCIRVSNLAVSEKTSNSITLTWNDNHNTGASYTIYNNDDNSVVISGLTATNYTITGLTANTPYSFSVVANCTSEDASEAATIADRTECAPMSLPYTMGFEADEIMSTTAATALPWCSYRNVESVTNPNYPYSTASNPNSGSRSLYYYGTTATTYPAVMAFILPEVDVTNFPMNNNRVSFYAKMGSASDNKVVKAYTLTDPTDWSTAVLVDQVTVSGTAYESYTINLSAATATHAYLALAVERGSGTLYLDDLTLEEIPACMDVTNLQVTDLTTNSVSLAWDDDVNPATTGYTVSYTDGDGDHSQTVAAGVHVATITGLTSNTDYTFEVVANCSAANSPASAVTCHTECDLMTTLPYEYGFEGAATGTATGAVFDAECWKHLNNGTQYFGHPYISSTASYCHSGSRGLYWYNSNNTAGTYGEYQCIVLPGVGGTYDMSNLRLKFWARSTSASTNPVFTVGVMTDPTDITTFTAVETINVEGTTYTEYAAMLTGYTGTGRYVAIRADRPATAWTATLDDVTLEEIPTMISVEASNVTANSVDLDWEVFRTCTGVTYTVTYGTQSVEVSDATSTTISNLTPNTVYTFEVSSSCAGANEPSVSVTVNTLQIPATLPYATGFETSDDNAMWTLVNGTNGWYFGTAAQNTGEQGLYISNNNGAENAYTNSNTGVQWSYAYRMLDISEAGWYNFSFDWKANGESNYDYLRAWLAPANVSLNVGTSPTGTTSANGYTSTNPTGWIDLNSGKMNLQTTWQSVEKVTEITDAGTYTLVLMWVNDNSGGSQPPVAVDNISVVRNAFAPTNLTATDITSTNATLTWTRDDRNAGVETYTIMNGTETVATDIDAASYTVDLTANTDYTFTLIAETDGDASEAANVSLRVNEYPTEPGKMANLTYSYDFTGVAESASVSFYYGKGDTRTAEAAQTLTAETATEATFTNTTSANWAVDGPVTVVFLNHNATVLNFSDDNVTYLCPAVITDTDPVEETINTGSYTWTTPENHVYNYGPVHGTTLNEQVAALVGSYNDTVFNAGQCDSVYRHLNLTLYPTYEVTLIDEFCQGTTYTVGEGDEAHSYTASIQEDVHLTAVGGADSLVHVDLHMNAAPVALINNNATATMSSYCEGFDLTLTATAVEGASAVTNAEFEWEDASTAATRTVNPLSTTQNIYTLTATDPVTGCVSLTPATLTVTTTPVPVLTVAADREAICLGQNSAVLSVTDANNIEGVNFRWYNANTSAVAGTGATLTVNPTETTSYYVVAEGDCEVQSAPITITVNPLPVVEVATSATVLCYGDELTVSATEGYATYSWNNGGNTAASTFAATATGAYTVTVTDVNGCVSEMTTANVTVNPVYELNDAQSVCYLSNPYTWGAMSITANGNYDQTFATVNGCDSLVHLTFTFEEMSINNTYREVCQNSDVVWGPTTYTNVQESTTLTYELGVGDVDPDNNILSCPAQYNLILTVNPVKATSFEQVACDSYTWNLNGETYTADATPSVVLATTKGCDSTVTMNLTVNYKNTGVDTQVACDRYEWPLNHNIYTASTDEPVVILAGANAAGCDSVVTLNLTVNYKQENTVFYRECDDTVFVWSEGNGLTYNRNVNPEDNITYKLTNTTTVDGCDSILRLHLVMNYVSDTLNWVNIEECDSWYVDTVACDGTIGRKYIDESGDYLLRTRNATTGRDQISRVHLTIQRSEHQSVVETQCVPWTWEVASNISHEITSDTVLSQQLETASGCQFIKVLRFTAKYPTEKTTPVTLCQNETWTDDNDVVYSMANYQLGENEPVLWNQTTNVAGCDSTDYVVFTVNPVYSTTAELTYCESEFATGAVTYANPNNANETVELTIPGALNEVAYTNTVVANWTTALGCDSVVTITYTVNPTLEEEETVQNCYTYTWENGNGQTYTESGDYVWQTSSEAGCDMTVTLHLTIADTIEEYTTVNACGEYEFGGVIYREDKTFAIDTTVAPSGCAQINFRTYHVIPRMMEDLYVVANAPYTWLNGETYSTSVDNIYYDATEPGGCDDIKVLHLTMEQPIVICVEELPYTTSFGITLTDDASNYTETIEGVLYDIDYTVNHNLGTSETEVVCDSYTWQYMTETLTTSGNYSVDYTDANGCAGTHTLALTINVNEGTAETEVACDSYTWQYMPAPLTESGNYSVDYTDGNGCEGTHTLTLTINVNEGTAETAVACDTYTWQYMTDPLTTSGNYSVDYTDGNGCTGAHTLALTVNYTAEGNTTVVRNEASTYYNGNYYADIAEANNGLPYTFDVTLEEGAANGCDSIDHVTLYVTRGTVHDENYNECGNFTWNRNNHTYAWIDAAERAANGNALYKDITDATAPVYIHTGENPIAMELDANGVATNTYVLWLNMIEANYFTYDLGDIMLSDVNSISVNPGDSLDAKTIDLSEYIAAKQNATLDVTLHHISNYYCENVVTYVANLIYNYDTVDPVTVCDVTTWTDPVDDVHTVTIGAANEIDYITTDNWHHHVVVNVTARTTSDPQVVTACDTYTWTAGNGETYTTSGNYNWNDDVNCTAETLQLTINNSNAATDPHVACDTYTWINGTTYTASNNTDTVMRTNVAGCDSVVTLNLTINTNSGITATEVACDSYTWTFQSFNATSSQMEDVSFTYTEGGVKTETYVDANGCEGTATLNLTINTNAGSTETAAECSSYTWNAPDGNDYTYTEGGTKTVSFTDANNCVGTATLNLTIYTPEVFTRDQFVFGNGITINGHFYAAAPTGVADYTVVLDTIDANGCATTVTVNLHVSQYEYVYTNHVGCGSYTWTATDNGNGHTYRTLTAEEATATPTAIYYDETADEAVTEMPQHSDGNMIYRLNLTLNEPSVTVVNVSIPMSQLIANGYVYTTVDGDIDCNEVATATADATVTYDFSKGPHAACDSIVRYNVNVIYNYVTDNPVVLCAATTYEVVAGDVRTVTFGDNTLTYTLNAGQATEEVHTVVVTVNDYTLSDPQVVTVCDTYTWEAGDEQTYTTSGTHTWNDVVNCTTETLNLTINTNTGMTADAEACDTYTWSAPDNNDYTYTESDSYSVTFADANGCEGTATLNLTINVNAGVEETVAACDDYTWSYTPTETYTESDTYTTTFTDGNGCEGTATLNLTINTNEGIDETEASCYSYTWNVANYTYDVVTEAYVEDPISNTYTESNTYTVDFRDVNGCVGTATLDLTINGSESRDTAFWFGDGSYRYTGIFTDATAHMYMPGDYTGITETVAGVTANGCDSIYNITLHVGNNYSLTDAVRSCNTYTWARNEHTYIRLTDEQRAANPTALYFDQTANEVVLYNPVVVEPQVNDYANEYMLDLTLDAVVEENVTVNVPVSAGSYTFDADHIYNFAMSHDAGREFEGDVITDEIHLNNPLYCDSIVYLTLNVVNNYVFDSVVDLCYSVSNYTWQGQNLMLDGDPDATNTYYMYDENATDAMVHYIEVIQHPIQYTTERRTECDSYTWNGRTFTESTSGATMNLSDMYGCDSTVTLVLTINHNTSTVLGSMDAPVEACDSYTWILGDGTELPDKITESGTYEWDYTTAEGCASHDVLYLTVNASTHTEEAVTACDSYTWDAPDGQTYVMSASEVKLVNYTNEYNCASTATLDLTINLSSADAVVEAACDSYTWPLNDVTYTESGVYTAVITNVAGCDSTVTLTLTIDNSNGTTVVTACDSYTWTDGDGLTYTESGIHEYTSNVANACGGSLTQTLDLTINHNSGHMDEVAICNSNLPAAGYEWNGGYYFTTGEYTYDYFDGNNCPSQDTLKLTVGNVRSYGRFYVQNCGPYTWDLTGETFTESTEASTIMEGANVGGCDSVLYLILTINPLTITEDVACDTYTWSVNNTTYTESGTYSVAETDDNGNCLSEQRLVLTINNHQNAEVNATACVSYIWEDNNNAEYTESGDYTRDITDVNGCAATETLHLTINSVTYGIDEQTACDSYTWPLNGETYTASTTEPTVTLPGAGMNQCDSIVTLNLTINVNSGSATTLAYCDSYEWNGTVYNESGDYYYQYNDVNGCASEDTLHLTISNSIANNFEVTACDSYAWIAVDNTDMGILTESGTYTHDYTTVDNCSGTETLVLTINTSNTGVDVQTACDEYTWIDGITYTESNNIATYTLTNAEGCDSVVTLDLTVNNSVVNDIAAVACGSYVWDGFYYTESGVYTKSYETIHGCDSTVNLTLTVNQPVTVAISEVACGSYTWNGITYNVSGEYSQTDVAENGCDSITTLSLTVNQPVYTTETAVACDNYEWNGTVYSATGEYTYTTEAANGCDSVVTLTLTVNNSEAREENVIACDTYTWDGNGMTYTESGVYTVNATNVAGCDSVVTLNLTVNSSVATEVNDIVACDNYVWNGSYYDQSGDYTYVTEAANGCDSTVTLHLTVNTSYATTESVTMCTSYEWNNTTYTESGIYTHTFEAENGCDSVATLYLTINNNVIPTAEAVTANDSYTWNGTEYTTGGVYTYTTEAENGCDSIATLYLTIRKAVNVTVNPANGGTVEGTGYYDEGATATLTAIAATGYEFAGWADDADAEETRTVVVNNTVSLVANFNILSYAVNVEVTGNGTVTNANTNYPYGTEVTLTAVPAANNHFVAWSDGNANPVRTVTVYGEVNLAATFAVDQYTVNAVAVNGTVTGTGTYDYGTQVTLTASSTSCYGFGGWYNGDAPLSNTASYTFTVTGNVNYTAIFEALTFGSTTTASICAGTAYIWSANNESYNEAGTYTYEGYTTAGCPSTETLVLTVNQPLNTTETAVECSSYTWNNTQYTNSGTYSYTFTDANNCTATATLNLTILQPANTADTVTACDSYTWNGMNYITSGDYSYSFTDANNCAATATLHLTVNQSTSNTVTETACESYTWNAVDGGNGVTYYTSGLYTYNTTNAAGCEHVTTLMLTINQPAYDTVFATAEGSYTWTAGTGATYTASGIYTYTTTALNGCDSNVTLILTITVPQIEEYTVTLAVNDATMGSVNQGATVTSGSTFAAMATANDGYHFVNWTDANNNVVSTANPYIFTVTADMTLTANFEADPVITYTVTLLTADADMGSVSAGAEVEAGQNFVATATPNAGYRFVAWTNNGVVVSTANPYSFQVTADITLTAVFEAVPIPTYVVEVIYDETMGMVEGAGVYEEGAICTLTATPKTGYRFVKWSTDDTTTTISFEVIADMTITATFEVVSIDEIEMENVTIYAADGNIYVKGAEGKQVVLFDVNGRVMSREANAAETVEFRVSASGVYLVKVGNAAAKRVVVIR